MNKELKYTNVAFSIVLGIAVFVFFGFYYRFHLLYQEQLQLFLFTADYLSDVVTKPGGLSEYLARFLTQFYAIPWLGALLIAFLLTLMQRQIQAIAFLFGQTPLLIPLTYIPSLLYWVLLCEEHYMLTGVVSLVIVLSAVLFYSLISSRLMRVIYLSILLPSLYWLTGGASILLGILCMLLEANRKELVGRNRLFFHLMVLLLMLLPPLLTAFFYLQIPLDNVFLGADFYRFKRIHPLSVGLVWGSILVIPCFFCIPFRERATSRWSVWLAIQFCLLVCGVMYALFRVADWDKEEVMAYDYFIYTKQWEKAIALANRQAPSSPLSVSCLNLALCKRGTMPDRMFAYYQNGPEGLIPSYTGDFTLPLIAGEIYYHLGFINTAQRYAFEAMEAIPDYQKSARAIKRLAETNLINGEYAVAKKYLTLLQHTLFYSQWAEEAGSCLGDEEKIQANEEWAQLRKYRTKSDFLFSDQEKDMMLGMLLQQDYSNRMAYEYLLAYTLLTKNLKSFLTYYPLGKELGYATIPKSYQEALLYIWGLTNNDPTQHIPYPITDQIKQRVEAYGKIYTRFQHAQPLLEKQYADTYWYYLHYRK